MRTRRALLTAFALPAAIAGAQPLRPTSLRVERSVEESCPDEGALRREVERRVGGGSFVDDGARVIVVRYRPAWRGRRRAQVAVREGPGPAAVRELALDGPGCDDLAEAIALAVALVIDPDAALRPLSPPPPPRPPLPEAAAPTCPEVPRAQCPACAACPAPPPSAPVGPPRPGLVRRPTWIALTGGLVVGVAPAPAPDVGFTVLLPLRGALGLGLGASYMPPVATSDGAASVGRTVARVGACLDTAPSWIQVGGCAGALAGVLHLAALALVPVAPGDRVWLGASAEAHARLLPGDRWVISLQARVVVPLLTWAPRVEGAPSPSFSPPPVAFEADLAVGVRLP
jgi:hypothetical protein